MSDINNEIKEHNNTNEPSNIDAAHYANYSFEQVYEALHETLSLSEINTLYAKATKQRDKQQAAKRKYSVQGNPQLQQAESLDITRTRLAHVEDQADAMLYSNDYVPELDGGYVNEGDVASRFSPAAYLTDLYREARPLHATSSLYHIDKRRPDIGELLLNQDNQDDEVSTLMLSNEILIRAIKEKTGRADIDNTLEECNLPYDAKFEKWQQILAARKTTAAELWPEEADKEAVVCLGLGISFSCYLQLKTPPKLESVPTSPAEIAVYYALPLTVVNETIRLLAAEKDKDTYPTALHRLFLLYKATNLSPQTLVGVVLKAEDMDNSLAQLHLIKIWQQRYSLSEQDALAISKVDWNTPRGVNSNVAIVAQCLQLDPQDLVRLIDEYKISYKPRYSSQLERVFRITQQLKQSNLNLSDLLKIADVKNEASLRAETKHWLIQLQQHESDESPMASVLATEFGLTIEVANNLLQWCEKGEQGRNLEKIWSDITTLWSNGKDLETSFAFLRSRNIEFFYRQLAQLSRIYKTLQLSDQEMELLVATDFKSRFTIDTELNNVSTIIELMEFQHWVRSLNAEQADVLFTELKAGTLNLQKLAILIGEPADSFNYLQYSVEAYKPDNANITGYLPQYNDAYKPGANIVNFYDIQEVLHWQQAAKILQVPVPLNLPLYDRIHTFSTSIDYLTSLFDAAFEKLPTAEQATIEATLVEKQGAALTYYYLNKIADQSLQLQTRDDLYGYLLIDNQVSMKIKTGRIAEACASLQLYINRCYYQAQLEPTVNKLIFTRAFFTHWEATNKRYSSWAGTQQLTYFPENYIDPALRIGQTSMMDTLLQSINQGQLTADTVEDAFKTYLTEFEEIANLSVISGYHDDISIDNGLTYFIGESLASPPNYYWRTVDHAQFSEGKFPASAWSEWKKISCSAMPYNQLIRPVRFNSRLHLLWLERHEDTRNRKSEDGEKWLYELKLSHLRYNGSWSTPFTFAIAEDKPLAEVNLGGLHCTVLDSPAKIYVSLYPKKDRYDDASITKDVQTWVIDQMMNEAVLLTNKPNWIQGVQNEFDTTTERRISNLYSGETKFFVPNVTVGEAQKTPDKKGGSIDIASNGFTYLKIVSQTDSNITLQLRPARVMVKASNIPAKGIDYSLLQKVYNEHGVSKPYIVYTGTVYRDTDIHIPIDDYQCYICVIVVHLTEHQFKAYTSVRVYNEIRGKLSELSSTSKHFANSLFSGVLKGKMLRFPDNINVAVPLPGTEPQEQLHTFTHRLIESLYPPFRHKMIAEDSGGQQSIAGQHSYLIQIPNELRITANAGGINQVEYYKLSHILDRTVTPDMDINDLIEGYKDWNELITLTIPLGKTPPTAINLKYNCASTGFSFGSVEQTIPVSVIPKSSENYLALKTNDAQAQYLQWDKTKMHQARLNTLFAKELMRRADAGIQTILSHDTQMISEPNLGTGNDQSMDFAGANALYFWELFYYTPMLVMQRLLQEQNFDLATQWLSYVFNPAQSEPWKTRPLREDTAWNDIPQDATNPDAVAQADPMHYKLSTFMRMLDLLLARGDHAYRQRQRDTLAEAKMWYIQASTLLGEEPAPADHAIPWADVSLNDSAAAQTSLFKPQQNTKLHSYRQTLKSRLYNLRHNLSIDGQPMDLPLFAKPDDPKELLDSASSSSKGGVKLPAGLSIGLQRFPVGLENAKSMVSQLSQFGNSLANVIERQDAEKMASLLQTQGKELLIQSVAMQKNNLEELHHEALGLSAALTGATQRYEHYKNLYEENINAGENSAIDLRATAGYIGTSTTALHMTAAGLDMVPNIYGMAVGGTRYGAIANAIAIGSSIASSVASIAADGINTNEMYRRRRQEWGIYRDNAQAEVEQLTTQQAAQKVRETAAELQVTYLETQQKQHQAQWELMTSKFSNQALYNWMRGHLSALYFQFYDLAISRCIRVQYGYQWETLDKTSFIKPGAWQGTYAGLLCAEALMVNLATMEEAYQKWEERALEVERTVSLAELYSEIYNEAYKKASGKDFSLQERVASLLDRTAIDLAGSGKNTLELDKNQLEASFSLAGLKLGDDYPASMNLGKKRRIKQISVSLPALLGPYQDVQAVLSYTGNEIGFAKGCDAIAVSRGMNDSGQFQLDFNDSKYLPFEGLDINDDSALKLRFPNATGKQKDLLQSLSDIILHIRYTIRS
ncbi:neuraminidase-like domain-containing protein [Yersinia rochesterensis]|uniref:Tc toxin subunit A-related protein n=1 Tax=Yersinia rochesterensis TaxID=1604335 RepID=UPI0011A0F607|nr:neuraminidase-like domain-containing protein [Yersinia rochesterensis]